MFVHVDGDVIIYRAGFAAEHTLYHVHYRDESGEQQTQSFDKAKLCGEFVADKKLSPVEHWIETEFFVEEESRATYNVRSIINSIADELQVDPFEEVRVYLSGPDNYRYGISTVKPYKGNRPLDRKPVHAPALKDYIRTHYQHKVSDGQEADDDMGIAHYTMWCEDPESTVIATIDKDLDTIPGMHYNFVTKETYLVTPEDADKFFWQQMVSGDPVDNIPGIPRYGKVKAQKFVEEHWPNVYEPLKALYVQSYGDKAEDIMLEMGRLLYIRKRPDEWWQLPKEERGDTTND